MLAEARPQLERERERVRGELASHLGELVVTAAERVIGEAVDGSRHQRLIDAIGAGEQAAPVSDGSQA